MFIRTDHAQKPLEPPYSSLYKIIENSSKKLGASLNAQQEWGTNYSQQSLGYKSFS